jgi:hypothetical protein
VADKPGYWLPLTVLLFAVAVPFTFVPVAGNWLRAIAGYLFGAVLFAVACTQAAEGGISLRRALALVGPAVPTLLAIAFVVTAVEQAVELPVLRAIASDEEFALYAYAAIPRHQPRPAIDLVHSIIGVFVPTVFAFAGPLAILHSVRAAAALRASAAAFALSPATYLGFTVAAVLAPHSLIYLGLIGILAFLAIVLLLGPSGYLVFRSAFGEIGVGRESEP